MKKIFGFGLAGVATLCVFIFTQTATAGTVDAGNGWTCTADKIKEARYKGGKRAYIHLDPYGRGDNYRVTLNSTKTEATGKTGDDTPFVCKKG